MQYRMLAAAALVLGYLATTASAQSSAEPAAAESIGTEPTYVESSPLFSALPSVAFPEFDPAAVDSIATPAAWLDEAPAQPVATEAMRLASASSSNNVSTAWGDCCGDGRCGWNLGVGVSFVQPRWSTNPAMFLGSGVGPIGITERSFQWETQGAPQVWLGYTGEQGLGFRTQWFSFDGESEAVNETLDGVNTLALLSPVIGNALSATNVPGDVMSAKSTLKLNAIDAEFTKAFTYRRGQYLLSGGGRYAYISQAYDSLLVDNGGAFLESLTAGHNAAVFGPTAAIMARIPSRSLPRLGYYGKARGALLFGQGNRVVNLDSILTFPQQFLSSSDITVPMTELEVGLDWNRNYGRAGFFLQTGLTAQMWYGVGNGAGSSTSSILPFGTASAHDTSNLGLYGLRTACGFNF